MARPVKFLPHWSESDQAWFVSIPPKLSKTGKRARLFFKDKHDALRAASNLKERHQKFGVSLSSIDPIRLTEASEAYKRLDALGRPYSLLSIVQDWIYRTEAKSRSKTILETFDAYVEAKGHLSAVHRQQILTVKHRFEQIGTAVPISDLEPKHIEQVLSPLASGSRNRYLRILRAVFNYAIRKDWTKQNPVDKLDFAVLPKRSIEIFTNNQIQRMLDISLATTIAMVPYFALGAFAGLRVDSGEMTKLEWSDIHFNEKTIVVRAEIAKTGRKRFIPLVDNLNAWLTAYLNKSLQPRTKPVITLPYGTLRKARKRIFALVSPGQAWIPAGLRHSFASAMINSRRTIDDTVLALGHIGSPTMLWNNYHLAMPTEQAEEYWKILP